MVEQSIETSRERQLGLASFGAWDSRPALGRRIGFVSTRLSGTDGVSLETRKWASVLGAQAHGCFYYAGRCEHPAEQSYIVDQAPFDDRAVDAAGKLAFSQRWCEPDMREATTPERCQGNGRSYPNELRPSALTRRLRELTEHLKTSLYRYVREYDLELLIVENALSIPMNLALGVALTEFISETGLPTIAHHHDFYWERKRFQANCVADFLDLSFPPRLPSVRHVVISSLAAQQLSWRKGLSSAVIPNVMDFAHPAPPADAYARSLRGALALADDELLILQPTRVVQRKGIEHAIELVRRLGRPARLVISHAGGDEGGDYPQRVREFAELLGVRVTIASGLVADERGRAPDGSRLYTLADIYSQADLVTYPSHEEGFGNAFLEAIYYRRPLLVNNYLVYAVDIRPKGFQVIEFEDFLTDRVIRQAQKVLDQPSLAMGMTETNYELGMRHYSYAVLEDRLQAILADLFQ